ncbi:MAG: FumA C-terminus/TtdB family hydratase beta subunit [Candidatus Omnitrophica bacterium]|nr:FumA C-terminus/TtdB family hydratase beta subunit [Candidatus Omnitrophota bacterium]
MKKINTPLSENDILNLRAGDEILLSGEIYTARDQAHRRVVDAIKKGSRLPFALKNAVIYYCGPAKTPKGKIIGSCGPTTSSRMDAFTPLLLSKGLKGMIGKGARSKEVRSAIKKNKAIYLLAPAGCGALISKYVKSAKPIAYQDLGPERITKLEVKDFPLIVGIDAKGRSIYA